MSDPVIAPPAWSQVRVPTHRKNATRVEFRFDPEYIRTSWMTGLGTNKTIPTRGTFIPGTEVLLLQDEIETQGNLIKVTAWLVPDFFEGTNHLNVKILAPRVIRRTLHVTLHWGYRSHTSTLEMGHYEFEDITLNNFSEDFLDKPMPEFWLSVEYENGGSVCKRANR